MYIWLVNCIAAVSLAAFCAGIVIPQILLIAFRKKLFDEIDERKIHRALVPRLGGLAFEPVIMFTLLFILGVNVSFLQDNTETLALANCKEFLFAFCAIILVYLIGIADDLIGVKYRAKFIAQVLCASLMICGGIYVTSLHGVFGIYNLPLYIAWPFTVLLMVFIVNAINLIDGIDGLASGLSGIACLIYGTVYYSMGEYLYAMLAFATLGVLLPFFYFNVFGNPEKKQKIFMGDTGSLSIGTILSFLSIHMSMSPARETFDGVNIMVLAFSPLLIPCCDVVRVYLRRLRMGKNPFMPDRTHIHHKLLAAGLNQRAAMVTIVMSSLTFTILNVILSLYININFILILDGAFWIAANIWLSQIATRRSKKTE